MDYGHLFRRSWEIVWENKFLFILGFLAALSGGGGNGGGRGNINFPSSSSSSGPFPSDFPSEFGDFWAQYGGLFIGLICFLIILGIVFWLVSLAAQGGMIEAVDRIEAGEKMSFGKAFSAGVGRIGSLVGLHLLINAPFILIGLLFTGLFAGFFINLIQQGDNFPDAAGGFFAFLAVCGGLLVCVLIPLGLVVTVVHPFAQRGLMLQKLGIVDSIRHGWQIVKDNVGDVILLIVAFLVIGIMFGIVTAIVAIPFAFAAMGPFLWDAIQGNSFNIGTTEIVGMVIGGVCLGLVGAAINAALTAYRSTTVTLAYHQFVQKAG